MKGGMDRKDFLGVAMATGMPVKRVTPTSKAPVTDEEREMIACLARLEVWKVENLLSPNGMDRFYVDGKR